MVDVICNSRKPAELKWIKVSRTLAETVSLRGMRGVYSEMLEFEGRLTGVLGALSKSREVTLVRRRIERLLRGRKDKGQ